jgi:hypothetical protein
MWAMAHKTDFEPPTAALVSVGIFFGTIDGK